VVVVDFVRGREPIATTTISTKTTDKPIVIGLHQAEVQYRPTGAIYSLSRVYSIDSEDYYGNRRYFDHLQVLDISIIKLPLLLCHPSRSTVFVAIIVCGRGK